MEPDGTVDKKEDSEVFAVDTRKTYESILSRKEAELAREAQFERRALALTKHFLKSHEQKESHRLDHLREASQRSYDRSMARVKQGFDSEAMLKEMVREEKNQISQLMSERARQRELEEERKREAKAEREYYMQARICYNQLQLEERHRAIEERQQERADAIKERLRTHQQKQTEKMQEKAATQNNNTAAFEEELKKVHERRLENQRNFNKERQEKMATRAGREKQALDDRQKRVEEMQRNIRGAEEERHRKVQEKRVLEERELSEKIQRMAEKFAPSSSRSHETSVSIDAHVSRSPAVRETRMRGSEVVDTTRGVANQNQPDESPGKTDEKKVKNGSALPTFHSKELIDKNNQAHKEYALRRKELDDAAHKMNIVKRYKVLAEGAEKTDDHYSTKLRSVYQKNIASKPREVKKDVPISLRGDQRPTPRLTPRTLTCGMCEREYPVDHLVGSALRHTIEKLRNLSPRQRKQAVPAEPSEDGAEVQNPRSTLKCANENCSYLVNTEVLHFGDYCCAKCKDSRSSGLSNHGPRCEMRPAGSAGWSPASPKSSTAKKQKSLYDYEVKLCVNCDIFIRIAST